MSVVKTLLNDLFINPNPLPSRVEIYQQLQNRIFPNKELFVKYLTTDDSNELTEIAKQLVQRLCFESHFSPPYSLLLNLLEFEKSDANKPDSGTYIPQDHFQHTLNTYLLGIYIFFYQPQINKRLTQEFMTRTDEGNPILNATKDFVSFWKYFCLFHDISYPLEAGYKRNEKGVTLDEKFIKYVDCFNNIPIQLMYEWIATIISNLIVINDVLNDSDNLFLPEFFTNNYVFTAGRADGSVLTTEIIRQELSDYMCLDKVSDFDHYKIFSGFVDEKEHIVVAFNLLSGEPVGIRWYDDENKTFSDCMVDNILCSQYHDDIKKLLISEEPIRSNKFGVRHFVRNGKKSFHNSLKGVAGPNSDIIVAQVKGYLDSLSFDQTVFTESQCSDLSLVVTPEDLNELVFYYYNKAYRYIEKSFESSPYSETMLKCITKKNTEKYLDYMASKFSSIIIAESKEQIEQTASNSSDKLKEWMNEGYPVTDEGLSVYAASAAKKYQLSDYIKEFIDTGFRLSDDQKTAIAENIAAKITNDIHTSMFETEGVVTLFDYLFNNLKKFVKDNTKEGVSFNTIKKIVLAPLNDPSTKKVFEEIDSFVKGRIYTNCENEVESIKYAQHKIDKKLPGCSLEEMLERYRNEKAKTTIDHGLMGSVILLYSQMLAHCFIPEIKTENGKYKNSAAAFLSPLFWSIDTKNYYKKLISNYTVVFSRAFSSVLCHNIYPDYLDWVSDRKWRFNLREDPCEYYGMFIDALQLWRRDKYHHHYISFIPLYSMDSYDIKAGSKTIALSVHGYTKDIKTLNDRLMGYDGYLQNFSSLVKLSILS